MKRNRLTWLCALLVLVVLTTSIFLVSCKDPEDSEKNDAYIIAMSEQTFFYDGQVHNVSASLNHNETQLKYDPVQGYAEKGEYEITVSADETENYKATSMKITLKIVDAPAKTVYELWEDFTDGISKSFALEGKEKLKVNVQAAANVKKSGVTTTYAIDVMGNIDLSQTQNNSTLFHAVVSADGNNIGVYYQDNAMYLEVGDQIFKIKNSDLTSILTSINSEQSTAGADLSGLLNLLPVILFRDENDIVCNDGVYEITIDVSHIWEIVNSDIVKNFLTMISKENMELLDGFFGANEIQFKFAVDLSDSDNAFSNVTVNDGNAYLGAFEIAGGSYDYVTGKLDDEKIQAASEINLANISVVGNIDLIDRTGKDYEHLTYKLVADIDPFALVSAIKSNPSGWMNDEDVKKMKLYFSLYHEHAPGENGVVCTDVMCPTRVGGQDDTSILDIAFDPTNFGDGKIYVAANLSRVFSDSSFRKMLTSLVSLAGFIVDKVEPLKTANFMTSIDLGLLLGGSSSEPGDPGEPNDPFEFDINTMLDPIISIITKCVNIENGSISVRLPEVYSLLNKAFDLDSLIQLELMGTVNTTNFANAVFNGILSPDGAAGTDAQFDALRIGVKEIEFGEVTDFNCKDAITHLPTDNSVARTYGGHKPLAFNDEANPKATGRVFNSKESLGDIFTAEQGIHINVNELDRIIGKNIEYTYKAIDGNTYTAKTQIVAIEGLNKDLIDQKQTVSAVVLPLDGQGGLLSDGLWQVLNNLYAFSLVGDNLPEHIALPIRADIVSLDLTLTEVGSYSFVVNKDCPETFEIAPIEMDANAKIDLSEYMTGKLTLNYTDGYSCVVDITATSDNLVDGKYLINDGKKYSFEFTYPAIEETIKTVEVYAITPNQPTLIDGGNGVIKVAVYGKDQKAKLSLRLMNSTGTSIAIPEGSYRVLVNGKLLDEINLSTDSAKVFDISNSVDDYKIEFDHTAFNKNSSFGYLYLCLLDEDGQVLSQVKLGSSSIQFKAERGEFASFGNTADVCANLDGKLTYYYWNESDDKYANARTLVLTMIDGKYYMVDNVENPTIKIEATVTAWKKGDATKTNILSDDYTIAWDKCKEMSYDAAKKGTQTPSIDVNVKFQLNGQEKEVSKTGVSLIKPYELGYTFMDAVALKTFDGMAKYTITTQSGEKHVMMLAYKDGKYVLTDTFDGVKFDDIDVTVVAKSTATGNPEVALTDGAFTADQVGAKVNLIINFTYDGFEYSYTFGSSKTIKAA